MVLEVAFVSGWILCSTTVLCVSALDMLVVYICGCSKLAAAIPDTLQLLICLILLIVVYLLLVFVRVFFDLSVWYKFNIP